MKEEVSLYENVQKIATRTFRDLSKVVMDKTLDAVAETTSMIMQEASKKDFANLPLQVVSSAEIKQMAEYVAEAQQAIERAEKTLLLYTRVYETSLSMFNHLRSNHPNTDDYNALLDALLAVDPKRVRAAVKGAKMHTKKAGGR
jgi:hypothetical protein